MADEATVSRPRRLARLHWAAVFACATAVAACGDDGSSSPGAGNRFAAQGGGLEVPLGQATCKDWDGATIQARQDLLAQLRANRAQPITGGGVEGRGSVLEDDFAYEFFENRCAHPASDSFLLYKLYGYAAAFGGTAP